MDKLNIRPSPIAGSWYPANPNTLANSMDQYLASAKNQTVHGQILAVIVPHAGHRYSGAVAAHAFALLRGLTPDLVVILSPFHNYDPRPLLITQHDAYQTPLGILPVDKTAVTELQAHLEVPISPIAHDREHSLEIELPFLQRIFQHEFKLLPIMIRNQEMEIAKALGSALTEMLKSRNALLIASTDLSHFYDQATAARFDHEMLKRFESLRPESIFEAEHAEIGFACGHVAVAAAQWAALGLGATRCQTLHYATSGDVTKDFTSVVGYGAAVITK